MTKTCTICKCSLINRKFNIKYCDDCKKVWKKEWGINYYKKNKTNPPAVRNKSESKFRYKVLNKLGKLEPWSGSWVTKLEADEWYKKHGVFFEKRGYTLKLVYTECND